MTLGALDALGPRVARALVVTRPDHFAAELRGRPGVECVPGDHPVPGPASLAAGEAVRRFVRETPPGARVLVLVSGGASSLVEALVDGATAEDLRALNEWALGAGLDVASLNALRRRLSRLKGGGLAASLAHARARALLISDVPDDDPAVIGSGLVVASPPGAVPLPPTLPEPLRTLFERLAPPPAGASLPVALVGTLDDALSAAERAARAQGCTVRRLPGRVAGDVRAAASRYAHELACGTDDVVVWGGEPTVVLPPSPGRGGRNQQFALACAELLAGHRDYVVLAAGTDGIDGNTADAGAIVDGGTARRGRDAGLEAAAALAAADAGTFLEASGDLLHTGPTGTNVGDVVFALRRAPQFGSDDGAPLDDERVEGLLADGTG
jgi:hydroxypyruvate reductase